MTPSVFPPEETFQYPANTIMDGQGGWDGGGDALKVVTPGTAQTQSNGFAADMEHDLDGFITDINGPWRCFIEFSFPEDVGENVFSLTVIVKANSGAIALQTQVIRDTINTLNVTVYDGVNANAGQTGPQTYDEIHTLEIRRNGVLGTISALVDNALIAATPPNGVASAVAETFEIDLSADLAVDFKIHNILLQNS